MKNKLSTIALVLAGALALTAGVAGQQVFRAATTLVRVDVIVRDKDGNIVHGLKADDFLVTEDGKPQQVSSFDFEEIATDALPSMAAVPTFSLTQQIMAGGRTATLAAPPSAATAGRATPVPVPAPAAADSVAPETLPGRRLVVMLFDASSMQPDEIDRAVKSADDYVDHQMSPADVVAVASIGQTLQMVHEFTTDRDVLKKALAGFDSTSGTGFDQPAAADSTDVSSDTDPADIPIDDSEFGIFNNDRRLKAIKVLCDAMSPLEQKKALMYFSSGLSRSGSDNDVELRSATNSCNKANTSIYTVDSRGLTAVVPGGASTQRSSGGQSAFSGSGMRNQFSSLQSSQETLSTLATDTGGEAFLDSNDFGPAYTKIQKDMSAYYLLGYSSTNPAKDGKFRRIAVKLKNTSLGYKLEARSGYYAESDFAHLAKEDRQHQLEDEISSAVSSTDLPVVASTSWFRIGTNQFYVPISVAVPGSYVHLPALTKPIPQGQEDKRVASLDLLGVVTDEQGRAVGKISDVVNVPAAQLAALGDAQLQYQSGVPLPAGHYKVKVAVREDTDGTLGTFEFPIVVPDLKDVPVKVSSVVLSTQLRRAGRGAGGARGYGGPGGRGGPGGGGGFGPQGFASRGGAGFGQTENPLIHNGQEIVQSLTHVVKPTDQMYFYYEVYDPTTGTAAAANPQLRTSLAFYRGKVKVFETPAVDHDVVDAPDRHASVFQFQLPASDLKPGLYTCQVNVIDEVAGKFAFPRIAIYVKGAK